MKVVLFCGGEGMRIRDYSESVPKPMVPVGNRPILWHVMKNYALAGHTDFILCLGHGSGSIKKYFLDYEEAESNDFVLDGGDKKLISTDIDDWTITFVDTGVRSELAERIRRVREHVEDEEMFFVNYADGVADIDHAAYVEAFRASGAQGALTLVDPPQSYHIVEMRDHMANGIVSMAGSGMWINGGFFIFTPALFDYLDEGNSWTGTLQRMMEDGRMYANPHKGFWMPMDTFKEKLRLDAMFDADDVPWLESPS